MISKPSKNFFGSFRKRYIPGSFASSAIRELPKTSPWKHFGAFTALGPGSTPARSFGAWARRIATNVSYDHLKSVRKEVEFSEERTGETPPDPAIQQDTRKRIRAAFAGLPPKLRLTATLALIEERPYDEIAESLGVPVGTVKSRVFRAVRILRQKLKELGIEQ